MEAAMYDIFAKGRKNLAAVMSQVASSSFYFVSICYVFFVFFHFSTNTYIERGLCEPNDREQHANQNWS